MAAMLCFAAVVPAAAQSTITPPAGYKVIDIPFETVIVSFVSADGTQTICYPELEVANVKNALYYQIDFYRWYTNVSAWGWDRNDHYPHPLQNRDTKTYFGQSSSAPSGYHWIGMPARLNASHLLNCNSWVALNYGQRMSRAVVPLAALNLSIALPDSDDTSFDVGETFEVLVSVEADASNEGAVNEIDWAQLILDPYDLAEVVSGPDPPGNPQNFSLEPGAKLERRFVLRALRKGTLKVSTDARGKSGAGFDVAPAPELLTLTLKRDFLRVDVEVEETRIKLQGDEEEPVAREIDALLKVTNITDKPIEIATIDDFNPVSLLVPPPFYGALAVASGPVDPEGANAAPLSLGPIEPGETVTRAYTLEASQQGEYEILAVVSGKEPDSEAGFTDHGKVEVEIVVTGQPELEAERPAPNAGFKTELREVFAGETIRFKGTGWDPEGGDISIAFAGIAVMTLPAAASFEEEFDLERFPQKSRFQMNAGFHPCAGALQAFQGDAKATVNIYGITAEEVFNGANIVNGLGHAFGRFDFVCAGEFIYPADGLSEVPFVGASEEDRLQYNPDTHVLEAQLHQTFLCENPQLSSPHFVIALPVDFMGRTLPDGKDLGEYSGPWLQYRTPQGGCFDLEGVCCEYIYIDGVPVYHGPSKAKGANPITLSNWVFSRPPHVGQCTFLSHNCSIVSSDPDPNDNDRDGISGVVDTGLDPSSSTLQAERDASLAEGPDHEFSDEFAHPNGNISGRILERNLHAVNISIDPGHPESLIIAGVGSGSGEAAEVEVCGIKVLIRSGDEVRVTCPPFRLEVLDGGPVLFHPGPNVAVEVRVDNGATISDSGLVTALSSNTRHVRIQQLPSTNSLVNPNQSFQTAPVPDADFDGTPDSEDACPSDFDKTAPGVCGCGKLDADSDDDGSLDCRDGCPYSVNGEACDCGNGEIDGDELCDSGPFSSGRHCNDVCTRVPCGQPTKQYGGGATVADALFVLKAAVGVASCDPQVCDTNGAGGITTTDALLVLRKSVGQSITLSCPGV